MTGVWVMLSSTLRCNFLTLLGFCGASAVKVYTKHIGQYQHFDGFFIWRLLFTSWTRSSYSLEGLLWWEVMSMRRVLTVKNMCLLSILFEPFNWNIIANDLFCRLFPIDDPQCKIQNPGKNCVSSFTHIWAIVKRSLPILRRKRSWNLRSRLNVTKSLKKLVNWQK